MPLPWTRRQFLKAFGIFTAWGVTRAWAHHRPTHKPRHHKVALPLMF